METMFDNLFIFELANNHQGNIQHGLKIIRTMGKIARALGINAGIKLQYRDLDSFIHPDYINDKENKHISRFLNTRMDSSDFLKLVQEIKNEGMVSICTPFDEVSVSLIMDHGIQIIKVASCSGNDWPLLEKIAATRKPVICSTGGLNMTQIDNLFSFLHNREVNFAILHCIGIYPAPPNNIYANFIQRLIQRFPTIPVGYSGHESPDDTDVIKIAVAKGAKIFERHVGIETDTIKLNAYSLNPSQVEAWVKAAQLAMNICGNSNEKQIAQKELDSLQTLKRGVFAKQEIKTGERLTSNKVFFAIPLKEDCTSTFDYHETMFATKDYNTNEPIHEERLVRGKVDLIWSIIHDIKGMLHEAKIVIGSSFKIEISHHYGIEHFRQTGAVIIDVINRVYCKKLVIVLPCQKHPTHYHKTKEETFLLLSGDIEITLNENQVVKLKPGESILVEPGTKHSFRSSGGGILEEVSTTHIKGDSVYDDENINKLELVERKTVIENL